MSRQLYALSFEHIQSATMLSRQGLDISAVCCLPSLRNLLWQGQASAHSSAEADAACPGSPIGLPLCCCTGGKQAHP